MLRIIENCWLICLVTFLHGCAGAVISLEEMYPPQTYNPLRNPVVFIHGFTGSRLVQKRTGKIVWGSLTARGIDPDTAPGLQALALPIPTNIDADGIPTLQDDIEEAGPMIEGEYSLLGLIDQRWAVYRDFLDAMGISYANTSCATNDRGVAPLGFCFGYDWRKDHVVNARLLGEFLEKTTHLVEQLDAERGIHRGRVRFDVVAHSMGGVIANYYMRYGTEDVCLTGKTPYVTWAGTEKIERLIQIGTPNNGSIHALRALLEGQKYSVLLFNIKYQPSVFATFPSVYQMLPRRTSRILVDERDFPVDLDIYDARVWSKNGWGILSQEQKEYRTALLSGVDQGVQVLERYLHAMFVRAQQVQEALDIQPTKPCPAQIIMFASQSFQTQHRARARCLQNRWQIDFKDELLRTPGDGIVTIESALDNLPFATVYLVEGGHLEMLKNRVLLNNLSYLLLKSRHE